MFVAHCCLRVQLSSICLITFFFFFFNDTAPTEIYTLSLHDALPILSGATIPVEIHGGPGDDVIVFGGSGDAFIFGDAGSDYIEASGSGTVVIRGGDEASTPTDVQGDYIVHSGTGFAVIDAGDGDDRVFGGSPSDIIVGNGGNDHITGPAAVIYGDFAPTEYSVSVLNQTLTFPNQGIDGAHLSGLTFADSNTIIAGGGQTAGQGDTLQLFGRDEGDLIEVTRPATGADQLQIVIARASDPLPRPTVTLPINEIEHL